MTEKDYRPKSQQDGWISVSDKLPENNQVILIYDDFWKEETKNHNQPIHSWSFFGLSWI